MDSSSEFDDEEIYESLIPTTLKDTEKNLKPIFFTDQQRLNQEELDIRLLLDLDPNNFHTDIDLDDTETLRKRPDFCCARRAFFGAEAPYLGVPPHINYDALPLQAVRTIQERDGS